MTTLDITILSIILIIIAIAIYLVVSNNSKNIYLEYLKCNLPTVAENIIQNILDDEYSINEIISLNNSNYDLYLKCMDFVRVEMNKYIDDYINNNIKEKFVSKLVKDFIKLDPSVIGDAIDLTLLHNGSDGENMYNKLIKLLSNYSSNKISGIEKEEAEAIEVAESYENETVEDVAEYNGEFDKSEYDIARENFETKEIEYPEEENLDEIPEELVEIIAGSETEEEIILADQSDND